MRYLMISLLVWVGFFFSLSPPWKYRLTCGWSFGVQDFECVMLCCDWSDLLHLRDRNVEDLSGGELQRFACAVVCIQKADMFVYFVFIFYFDRSHPFGLFEFDILVSV